MNKKGSISTIKRVLKMIANIFSWTALSILIIIAGCLIYYVVSSNIYASRGEKFEPPFSLYTIISPSMEPNIKVYDVIVDVRVKDPKEIQKGDIITFISSSSISAGFTVTHRVHDVIEDEKGLSFKTKGDNNLTPDSSPVTAENVLGKVVFKIPQLGRVQFLLASKGGWICLILIPALGIIIYDILKLFKLIKVKNKVEVAVESDKEVISEEQIAKEKARKKELKEKLKVPEETTVIKKEIKMKQDVENYVITKPANTIVSVGMPKKSIVEELPEENKVPVAKKAPISKKKITTPKKKAVAKKANARKKVEKMKKQQ